MFFFIFDVWVVVGVDVAFLLVSFMFIFSFVDICLRWVNEMFLLNFWIGFDFWRGINFWFFNRFWFSSFRLEGGFCCLEKLVILFSCFFFSGFLVCINNGEGMLRMVELVFTEVFVGEFVFSVNEGVVVFDVFRFVFLEGEEFDSYMIMSFFMMEFWFFKLGSCIWFLKDVLLKWRIFLVM